MKLAVLSLCCVLLCLTSCDNATDIEPGNYELMLSSFSFLRDNNPSLREDVDCVICGDSICAYIPDLDSTDSLIATFSGNYQSVKVGGVFQESGASYNNFNDSLKYCIEDRNGNQKIYRLLIKGGTGLPRIDIVTEGSQGIVSKDYVNAQVFINNTPEYGVINTSCKVRGRGNSTWGNYPKKPYMIKFNSKQSVFGFPENKKWVLLADYLDRSLMRTAYMCEVSKAVGVEWTINYQHVDLFVNGDYRGTYLLTDHVEKGKNRVNIDKDGFLIENDYYYYMEPLSFTSSMYNCNYSFKYPDADDMEIVKDDDNYIFILNYINAFEEALVKIEEDAYDDSYMNYIDIESFCKWYICANLIAMEDPNLFYVMHSKKDRLHMMPMWDAEYSLGTWSNTWPDKRPEPLVESQIWTQPYFPTLLKSPIFVDALQKHWRESKNNIAQVEKNVALKSKLIENAALKNISKWKEPDVTHLYVYFDTWEEELEYVNSFFEERVRWFDRFVNSL